MLAVLKTGSTVKSKNNSIKLLHPTTFPNFNARSAKLLSPKPSPWSKATSSTWSPSTSLIDPTLSWRASVGNRRKKKEIYIWSHLMKDAPWKLEGDINARSGWPTFRFPVSTARSASKMKSFTWKTWSLNSGPWSSLRKNSRLISTAMWSYNMEGYAWVSRSAPKLQSNSRTPMKKMIISTDSIK